MVVREKNCYYAIALTDFFVFLSCAEEFFILKAHYFFAKNSKNLIMHSKVWYDMGIFDND